MLTSRRDVALAYSMPFISGKDSLNNEFRIPLFPRIVIPPTLLISALGIVPDHAPAMRRGMPSGPGRSSA